MIEEESNAMVQVVGTEREGSAVETFVYRRTCMAHESLRSDAIWSLERRDIGRRDAQMESDEVPVNVRS